MRISTNVLFESGSARISELQSSLAKTQDQISTGRRILNPSDDPVGASQALLTTQAAAANQQLATNRGNAKSALSHEESVLQGTTGLLLDVKDLIVKAGNGALDQQQRKFYASELSGIMEQMLNMANTQDGAGNYLFSGYSNGIQPFSKTATGSQYSGDQGQRFLQVGASRQLATGDSGTTIFQSIKTGNGTFATAASASNQGSGIVSGGAVTNAALLTGRNYNLTFTVNATTGATTYDVTDTTVPALLPAPVLPTAVSYVSGQAISFNGMQFDVSGSPANADVFTIVPSTNQDIFTTLTSLVGVLNAPASGTAGQTALTNGLNTANTNVSNALDNILQVRASVGIRLKELDTLDSHGDDLNLQYQQQLEQLQGLDYTKAITDLTKEKIMLEAAQQSFVKTSSLSLFNYI
jgi:flagellar hook-associated protein 3 FlgL